MINLDETRIYTRRDSATSALRKMGVKSDLYPIFLKNQGDGQVLCYYGQALGYSKGIIELEVHGTPKVEVTHAATPKNRRKTDRPKTVDGESITDMCTRLILEGLGNKEIFEILQKEFGKERFDDSKKAYPSWYRCRLRRLGQLPTSAEIEKTQRRRKETRIEQEG